MAIEIIFMQNFITIIDKMLSSFFSNNLVINLVLLTLLTMSIISLTLIIRKMRFIKNLEKQMKKFDDKFWSGSPLETIYNESNEGDTELLPYNTQMFILTMDEWLLSEIAQNQDSIELTKSGAKDRFVRVSENVFIKLESLLSSSLSKLHTISSCSPFVGLFGTVIGVMNSFSAIAKSGNAGINIVAPGISEALFTTAVGIFVAIVSTIFYNYLNLKQDKLVLSLENFQNDLINILSRELDKISISNYNSYNSKSTRGSKPYASSGDQKITAKPSSSNKNDDDFDIDDL